MSDPRKAPGGCDSIPAALQALQDGQIIIVVDDEDRENEGDFIIAAEKVTPQAVNFIAKHGRGLVCLAATGERLRDLDIAPMVSRNTAALGTNFTVSIDAAAGVSTGISAADRARTVQVFIDPQTRPQDLARPGHIFPLEAQPGGCCGAPVIPRPWLICAGQRVYTPRVCCAKSWTRTGKWLACPVCGNWLPLTTCV